MINRRPTSDEELSDYIDGRLDEARRAALEAKIAADPALARRFSTMVEQDRLLRRLGEDILREPVPERLMKILRRQDDEAPAHHVPGKSSKLPQIAMLAGAIGALLAQLPGHAAPVQTTAGQLLASPAVHPDRTSD